MSPVIDWLLPCASIGFEGSTASAWWDCGRPRSEIGGNICPRVSFSHFPSYVRLLLHQSAASSRFPWRHTTVGGPSSSRQRWWAAPHLFLFSPLLCRLVSSISASPASSSPASAPGPAPHVTRTARRHGRTAGAAASALARAASDDGLAYGAEAFEENRGPDGDGDHGRTVRHWLGRRRPQALSSTAARTARDLAARRTAGSRLEKEHDGTVRRRTHPLQCSDWRLMLFVLALCV